MNIYKNKWFFSVINYVHAPKLSLGWIRTSSVKGNFRNHRTDCNKIWEHTFVFGLRYWLRRLKSILQQMDRYRPRDLKKLAIVAWGWKPTPNILDLEKGRKPYLRIYDKVPWALDYSCLNASGFVLFVSERSKKICCENSMLKVYGGAARRKNEI